MKHIAIVLVLFVLLALPTTVQADVAPPEQPPGANPGPGSTGTQVRMQSESVLIDVQAVAPAKSLGRALVTADFDMFNTGSQAESMDVRFPISGNDGFSNYPEISDLQVSVNGSAVSSRRTTGKDPFGYDDTVPWAAFAVTFPAGQVTQIRVTYTLEASGLSPYIWFYYIFSTGAGWQGSIGSAELTVRLPYAANEQNVIRNQTAENSPTKAGGTILGNEIHWSYNDFEPTKADNFIIELVQPSVWQTVLKDQAAVEQNLKDGEAWGMLGKQYKQIFISPKRRGFRTYHIATDSGAQALYALSRQAYEQAVTLKPDDPLWHAGYADLLGYYANFAKEEGIDTSTDAVAALSQIRQALALAPADATVRQIADEMTFYFPDGMKANDDSYDYPWLTATPTLLPTEISVSTLNATPTQAVIEAATPTILEPTKAVSQQTAATPAQNAGQTSRKPFLPICGSALLLLPLGALFWRNLRT